MTKTLHTQFELFLTAVQFLTRLPVPSSLPYSSERLGQSTAYYPLVGFLVGGLCALVMIATPETWSTPTRVILATIVSLLITGAFHEDGLADACDGFGGGWTRERVLDIMKDSRLGTFGVAGLISVLSAKVALLSEVSLTALPVVVILGHGYSRFLAVALAYRIPYVGDTIRDKPTASGISGRALVWAALLTLIPLSLTNLSWLAWILPVLTTLALGTFFLRRIGGYTGDCLGACQSLTEVSFYLGVVW